MIFAITVCSVASPKFMQTHGVSVSKITNMSVIDAVEIDDSIVYIIAANRSIMAMGEHSGLFGQQKQLDFTYINVDGARQLFSDDQTFGYVSDSGEVYYQKTESNKVSYELMPKQIPPILQLVGNRRTFLIARTASDLYFKGNCEPETRVCGDLEPKMYTEFTKIPLDFAADISNIEINFDSTVNLYLKNSDVYSIGLDPQGLLPVAPSTKNSQILRKIGTEMTRVSMGFNLTLAQFSTYYLKNNNLYVYNKNATPQERLVQESVFDFISFGFYEQLQNLLILKENSVVFFSQQQIQSQSPTEIYCKNKKNTLCANLEESAIRAECYDGQVLKIENEICTLFDCEYNQQSTQNCEASQCAQSDIFCNALSCQNSLDFALNPKCFFNYNERAFSAPFENAKDYKLQNFLMIQVRDSPVKPVEPVSENKMKTGTAVGISIGVCCGVFTLLMVLTVSYFHKQGQKNTMKKKTKTMQGMI
ncbi:Regulator_of chromosome condensation 1/beta-lactamase-inhibitor protein II [Hexamita inflata]|uniref:Regulator of chromosome condensation 1/beta-lactamase-inhibitor protein II n=1 Tax=Hexamita inflata TaxID=28002 RepID=A0AA86QGG6_9EUKA|nr:Regulator of chromosome condensation 1/beta-lactamase-inhibitor protein II [Hexamita inflata]